MQQYQQYNRVAIGRMQTMAHARQARRGFQTGAMQYRGQPLAPGRFAIGAGYYAPYGNHPARYAIGNGIGCAPCPVNPINPCPDPIDVCPPDAKRIILNFESAAVAAGASVVVTARPQTVFRPDQFIVPSTFGLAFTIDDIKIGNRSQYTAAGRASAVVFSEVSVNSQVKFDTAQGGIDVILNITNVSGEEADFFATMIGPAIQAM